MSKLKTLKEQLMTYPKEVLIDYLLNRNVWLLHEWNFRQLDFLKLQARQKKLLEEWKQIEDRFSGLKLETDRGRAQYWAGQIRLNEIMEEVELINEKSDALLGLNEKLPAVQGVKRG